MLFIELYSMGDLPEKNFIGIDWEMLRYEMIWYEMARYFMGWYDVILYYGQCNVFLSYIPGIQRLGE